MGALQSQLALGFRKKNIPNMTVLWMFPKNRGCFPPQIIHFKRGLPWFWHPFWGFSSFFWKHPYQSYISIGCLRICFFRIWARHQPLTMHALSIWPHKPKTSEDFGAVIFPNLLWQFSICFSPKTAKNPTRDSRFLVGVFLNLPSANRSDLRVTGVSLQRLRLIKQRDGKEINENQSMNYEF